ncbi:hypothetical protein EGW08_004320, partial [Elysia chlorotica]
RPQGGLAQAVASVVGFGRRLDVVEGHSRCARAAILFGRLKLDALDLPVPGGHREGEATFWQISHNQVSCFSY